MDWKQGLADMEAADPAFKAARQELRPQYEFRRALIAARLEAGLTQRQMAERLGIKQPALARWEAGETLPTVTTLHRVAQVLGLEFTITPDEPLTVRPHQAA